MRAGKSVRCALLKTQMRAIFPFKGSQFVKLPAAPQAAVANFGSFAVALTSLSQFGPQAGVARKGQFPRQEYVNSTFAYRSIMIS